MKVLCTSTTVADSALASNLRRRTATLTATTLCASSSPSPLLLLLSTLALPLSAQDTSALVTKYGQHTAFLRSFCGSEQLMLQADGTPVAACEQVPWTLSGVQLKSVEASGPEVTFHLQFRRVPPDVLTLRCHAVACSGQ
jgi:hypothetical protein